MPFGDLGRIVGNVLSEAERATKRLKKEIECAGKKISKTASKALSDIKSESNNASKNLNRSMQKVSSDIGRELTWVKEDIDEEALRAKQNLEKDATRMKQDIDEEATRAKEKIDREAKRTKGKLDKTVTRLKQNIDREANRGKQNIDQELTNFKQDIDREATKLKSDIERELDTAKEDVDEAVSAAMTFVEHNMQSLNETIAETGELLSEGKVLDALAYAATEPYKDAKGAYVAAVSESKLLSQAASAVITAYGGPTAGAAYSAWLTYEMTGNLEAAIQAGLVLAISAEGGEFVSGLPTKTISDQAMREVARASVNAAAVAVSGGSKEDIEEAFMSTVVNAAQTKAQVALQTWVKTEVAPKFGVIDQPDMVDIGNKSLIDKVQTLNEDVEVFRKKYEHLVKAALDTEEFIRERTEELTEDVVVAD